MCHRALIVEDHVATRQALLDYFTAAGYQADGAATLAEALSLLDAGRYEIAITDLRLDAGGSNDGLELVSAVRRRAPRMPVMLVTSLVSPQLEREALRRGADAVLVKPQPLPCLLQIANDLIRRVRTPYSA